MCEQRGKYIQNSCSIFEPCSMPWFRGQIRTYTHILTARREKDHAVGSVYPTKLEHVDAERVIGFHIFCTHEATASGLYMHERFANLFSIERKVMFC